MVRRSGLAILLAGLAAVPLVAAGADKAGAGGKPPPARKHIRMSDPMTTGMMKPGMKKGEVKRAAERKSKDMAPAMEREEQSMPPPAKP